MNNAPATIALIPMGPHRLQDAHEIVRAHRQRILSEGEDVFYPTLKAPLCFPSETQGIMSFRSRRQHLTDIQKQLPQEDELDEVAGIIREESVPQKRRAVNMQLIDLSAPRPQRVLSYAAYKRSRERAIEKYPQFKDFFQQNMNAIAFASLPRHADAEEPVVLADSVIEFLVASVEVSCQRLWLAIREDNVGYISHMALQVMLLALSAESPIVAERVDEQNRPFYEETIVAYSLFFLDPKNTGRIMTEDFLASHVLQQILAIREKGFVDELQAALSQGRILDNLSGFNWFAPSITDSFYQSFLTLDDDHNGLLLPRELLNYDTGGGIGRIGGGLTTYFVDRIYDVETQLYSGAMDWRGFIRVAIMLEHRSSYGALSKVFQLLGDDDGHITWLMAHQYVQAVIDDLRGIGDEVDFGPRRLVLELWDAIVPENQEYLTLRDCLRNPQKSGAALCVLYDSFMFYANDSR